MVATNYCAKGPTFLVFVGLFILPACTQPAQPLTSQQEAEITEQVMDAFESLVSASKTLETEPYLEHFSKDRFTASLDGSVLLSYSELEQLYAEQVPAVKAYLSLEFETVKVSVLNRYTAVLVNEYAETILLASGDTVSFAGSGAQVWGLEGSKWRLFNVSGSLKSDM